MKDLNKQQEDVIFNNTENEKQREKMFNMLAWEQDSKQTISLNVFFGK